MEHLDLKEATNLIKLQQDKIHQLEASLQDIHAKNQALVQLVSASDSFEAFEQLKLKLARSSAHQHAELHELQAQLEEAGQEINDLRKIQQSACNTPHLAMEKQALGFPQGTRVSKYKALFETKRDNSGNGPKRMKKAKKKATPCLRSSSNHYIPSFTRVKPLDSAS